MNKQLTECPKCQNFMEEEEYVFRCKCGNTVGKKPEGIEKKTNLSITKKNNREAGGEKMKINWGIVAVILFMIAIIVVWEAGVEDYLTYDDDCLDKRAMEICEEQGLDFERVMFDFDVEIWCSPEPGEFESIKLKFLPEELEGCRK